jgi:ArsR family transcriptional regulator
MATTLSDSSSSREIAPNGPGRPELAAGSEAILTDGIARELVRWFKLLADETRLKILFLLLERNELNVRSLCETLELSQPAVSHHLALLRADGLIECRRDGKHNFYRVLPERFSELLSKVMAAVPGDDSQSCLGQVRAELRRAVDE